MKYKGFLIAVLTLGSLILNFSTAAPINNDSSDPVVQIDLNYEAKQLEITALANQYRPDIELFKQLEDEELNLNRKKLQVAKDKLQAKQILEQNYSVLLNDPNHDISVYQTEYKLLWNKEKEVIQSIQTNKELLNQQEQNLKEFESRKRSLQEELVLIRASRDAARIARLNKELNVTEVIQATSTFSCNQNMTIGQCARDSHKAALRGGVSQFKDLVLSRVTEKDVIERNSGKIDLNIRVIHDRIIDSGFSNSSLTASTFKTRVEAQLQSQPKSFSACILLEIEEHYCSQQNVVNYSNSTPEFSGDKSESLKSYKLIIRSKQDNDTVTVNNVNYGKSPVEVYLSKDSNANISVSKPGYNSYSKSLKITKDMTIWADLTPKNKTKVITTKSKKTGSEYGILISDKNNDNVTISVTDPQK